MCSNKRSYYRRNNEKIKQIKFKIMVLKLFKMAFYLRMFNIEVNKYNIKKASTYLDKYREILAGVELKYNRAKRNAALCLETKKQDIDLLNGNLWKD